MYTCTSELDTLKGIIIKTASQIPINNSDLGLILGLQHPDVESYKDYIQWQLTKMAKEEIEISEKKTNIVGLFPDREIGTFDLRGEILRGYHLSSQNESLKILYKILKVVEQQNGRQVRQCELGKILGFKDYFLGSDNDYTIRGFVENFKAQGLLSKKTEKGKAMIGVGSKLLWTPIDSILGTTDKPQDVRRVIYSRGSKYEAKTQIHFTYADILYIPQKTFPGCVYKKPLKFDFYLPRYNYLVEIDGPQHYHPVKFFGGEEGFRLNQIRDKIKDDFARDNEIPLIRIKGDDVDVEIPKLIKMLKSK